MLLPQAIFNIIPVCKNGKKRNFTNLVTVITLHNIYAMDHLFAKSDPIWLLLLSAHASNMAKLEKGGKDWLICAMQCNALQIQFIEPNLCGQM